MQGESCTVLRLRLMGKLAMFHIQAEIKLTIGSPMSLERFVSVSVVDYCRVGSATNGAIRSSLGMRSLTKSHSSTRF